MTERAAATVAVIGGGPAGLMAAEVLIGGGARVDLYDAMPSVARKFLLAGKGGLNLTHTEPRDAFLDRYGARREWLAPLLDDFGPDQLRAWVHDFGIGTFVGSSGRVFPADMKAAPLLRAWLHRLRCAGVRFHARHRWCGWGDDGALRFSTPMGEHLVDPRAVVMALGGGSWARLGSDGKWTSLLAEQGIAVAPLLPANCGFDVAAGGEGGIGWSRHFSERFAGQPVKSAVISFTDTQGVEHRRLGEFVVGAHGVEGSLIYALSAPLRHRIELAGAVTVHVDLAPDKSLERIAQEVGHPRGSRSMSSHLQSRAGIKGVKAGLLRELLPASEFSDPARIAAAIKALPLRFIAPRPLDEAISSAGGVANGALDERLMLRARPGVFCAGEMLDWEAPTGGYLLTACFSTGRAAGLGALSWLKSAPAQCRFARE